MPTSLEKLRIYCAKITPLVYQNSLSYYESLCKCVEMINETINYLSVLEKELKDYTDEKVAHFKEYIDTSISNIYQQITQETETKLETQLHLILTELNTTEKELRFLIKSLETETNSHFTEIETNFENFKNLTNEHFTQIENYVDTECARFKNEINVQFNDFKTEIENLIDQAKIMCKNPVTGEQTSACEAINDVYNEFIQTYQFTCKEYADAGITCQQYADVDITCQQYALNGKKYFNKGEIVGEVTNPWEEDQKTSIQQAINDIYNIIGKGGN